MPDYAPRKEPPVSHVSSTPSRVLIPACSLFLFEATVYGVFPPLLPYYTSHFALSRVAAGIVTAGYSAAQFPGAAVSHRLTGVIGLRATMVAALLIFGAGGIALALAPTANILLAARAALGLASGVLMVAALRFLGTAVTQDDRGRAMGKTYASVTLGSVLGPTLATLAIATSITATLTGLGALTFLLVPWACSVPHSSSACPRLTPAVRACSAPRLRLALCLLLLHGVSFGMLAAILPLRLTHLGLSQTSVAIVFLSGSGVAAGVAVGAGQLADRIDRRILLTASLSIAGPLLALTALVTSAHPVAWLAVSVLGAVLPISYVPTLALMTDAADLLPDPSILPTLLVFTVAAGEAVGAAGGGAVAQMWGDAWPLLILAIADILTVVPCARLVPPREPRSENARLLATRAHTDTSASPTTTPSRASRGFPFRNDDIESISPCASRRRASPHVGRSAHIRRPSEVSVPPSQLGFAVIGGGTIGQVHARSIASSVCDGNLLWVIQRSRQAGTALADQYGARWASTIDAALADPRVDAIVVASPPSTHADFILRAAAAGKHVFSEKPLADSLTTAITAAEAVQQTGILFQIGFHRRFDADYQQLKARLLNGDLGAVRLYFSSMRDPTPPPDSVILGGEDTLIRDAACHEFDAARWLIGEVTELTTHGAVFSSDAFATTGQVDSAVIVLRFRAGALGAIDCTAAAGYGFDCRTEVVGADATARISAPSGSAIAWLSPGLVTTRHSTSFLQRFAPSYCSELVHFADCIRTDRQPEATVLDGLAAARLTDAALRSQQTGATIRLPPPGE